MSTESDTDGDGIFAPLIGHNGAKAILRSALRRGDVHLLLSGPPASGKSVALLAIEDAIEGAEYVDARGFSERKLRDKLAENPPVLLIDEFDNMKQDAFKALNTALEQGRVTKQVTHDSYDKEIDTQVFVACNYPEELPGDVEDRFVAVDFDPYTRAEYIDVCEVLLPEQVEWLSSEADPGGASREIARTVWDETDSRSPRTARDAARLADAAHRVPAIVKAMNDPKADVTSEPLTADELPHNQRDGESGAGESPTTKSLDDIREDMAEPDEMDDKSVNEVVQMLEVSDDGGDTSDGSDTTADDDPAGTVVEDDTEGGEVVDDADVPGYIEAIEGPGGEVYKVSKGGQREDGTGDFNQQPALEFIERMVDAGNRVMPNDYGSNLVEILVPRSNVNEMRELVKQWDINPQGPATRPSTPSMAEERPRVSEGLIAFQFILKGDELQSSGYDVESIVDGLQASDEPYLVTLSPQAQNAVEPSVFEE